MLKQIYCIYLIENVIVNTLYIIKKNLLLYKCISYYTMGESESVLSSFWIKKLRKLLCFLRLDYLPWTNDKNTHSKQITISNKLTHPFNDLSLNIPDYHKLKIGFFSLLDRRRLSRFTLHSLPISIRTDRLNKYAWHKKARDSSSYIARSLTHSLTFVYLFLIVLNV